MIDRDSCLLYEMYQQVLFNEASLKPITIPKEELIGQIVSIHPVVVPSPHEDDYMRWSVKLDKVIGYAETLHLKDCYADVKHDLINKKVRSLKEGDGQKAPIILLKGTIVDIDFPISELNSRIGSDFKSVTYNPHKHDEYLYADCLPDWWHTDERFWDVPRGERPKQNPIRQQGMKERMSQKYKDECEVSKKVSDALSYFKCTEAILKQHNVRKEDYMWVKGVYY